MVKKYIIWMSAVLGFVVFVVLTVSYLSIRRDYYILLDEKLDYKQDKYELLKSLKGLEKEIYLIRGRLDKYETLKKGIIQEFNSEPDEHSILLLSPQKFICVMRDLLAGYGNRVELLTSQLSYLSTRGRFMDIPSIWPASGWVSSSYGFRIHPIFRQRRFHEGIDIANSYGTPVLATASGKVSRVGNIGNYGRSVVIKHGNGLETQYSHLDKIFVEKGMSVDKGEEIALMGNSGLSTGPHIHYEVRVRDKTVDPLKFIF